MTDFISTILANTLVVFNLTITPFICPASRQAKKEGKDTMLYSYNANSADTKTEILTVDVNPPEAYKKVFKLKIEITPTLPVESTPDMTRELESMLTAVRHSISCIAVNNKVAVDMSEKEERQIGAKQFITITAKDSRQIELIEKDIGNALKFGHGMHWAGKGGDELPPIKAKTWTQKVEQPAQEAAPELQRV